MKKALVILVFLICISFACALTEYPGLIPGQSYVIKDKNITLLGISDDEESVLLCINNQKVILKEDKSVDGLGLSLRKVEGNKSMIKLTYKCSNCVCSQDCSNSLCMPKKKHEVNETKTQSNSMQNITSSAIKTIKIIQHETDQQPKKESSPLLAISIAAILVLLILVLAFARKIY